MKELGWISEAGANKAVDLVAHVMSEHDVDEWDTAFKMLGLKRAVMTVADREEIMKSCGMPVATTEQASYVSVNAHSPYVVAMHQCPDCTKGKVEMRCYRVSHETIEMLEWLATDIERDEKTTYVN